MTLWECQSLFKGFADFHTPPSDGQAEETEITQELYDEMVARYFV